MISTQSHRLTMRNIWRRLFESGMDCPPQYSYNKSIDEMTLVMVSMLDQIDDLQNQIKELTNANSSGS